MRMQKLRDFFGHASLKGDRALPSDGGGFTFLESMLSTAISALCLGAVLVAIFQINSLTCQQQDSLTLSQQLQNVATLLNHDVVSAASGMVSTESLTLQIPTYTFGQPATDPVTRTVVYTCSGPASEKTMTRDDGGGSTTIARHLESVDFGSWGNTLQITVTAVIRDQSCSTTLTFDRRPSDSG